MVYAQTSCNPPYPCKFKSGDVAIAKQDIVFTDGTVHRKGQRITVTEENKSYYNINYQYYANEDNLKPLHSESL